MRCRVTQVWSGKQWGGIFIPRIGMEVVVQFLEGDPDQPLVIGTVYNNENMPPFNCPTTRPSPASSRTRRRAAAATTSSSSRTRRARNFCA